MNRLDFARHSMISVARCRVFTSLFSLMRQRDPPPKSVTFCHISATLEGACSPRRESSGEMICANCAALSDKERYSWNMQISQHQLLPINDDGMSPEAREALRRLQGNAQSEFRGFTDPQQARQCCSGMADFWTRNLSHLDQTIKGAARLEGGEGYGGTGTGQQGAAAGQQGKQAR
jgi:hypothetical protein